MNSCFENGCNMENGLRMYKDYYNMGSGRLLNTYFLVNVPWVKAIIDEFGVCNVNVLSSFSHC